jgi:hypothetical protein
MNNPSIEQIRIALAERVNGRPRRLSITLASDSMSPLLPTGACAEIESCSLDELKFLDLVIFNWRSMLICHCFFGLNEFPNPSGERTFISRGLASKYFDDAIGESQLVGRVVTHKLSHTSYFIYRLFNRIFGTWLTRKVFYRSL